MKRLLSILALIAFTATAAAPAQSTITPKLAWDPNPESDIGGYIIYAWKVMPDGTEEDVSNIAYDVGNFTEVKIHDVIGDETTPGLWRFRATAYNTAGLESDPSNHVDWNPNRPSPPAIRFAYDINIQIQGN